MSNGDSQPYDFTKLDTAMYDPVTPDRYAQICSDAYNDVLDLETDAWEDVESKAGDGVEVYLMKCVVAAWRSLEAEHAERVSTSHGRALPFREAIILSMLLRSEEVSDDFLTIAAQYTREELLRKVSQASAVWLEKYHIRLDYDSEVEAKYSEWEIYISPQTD